MDNPSPITSKTSSASTSSVDGQLNSRERDLILQYLVMGETPPMIAVEVGTWLGGGSTMVILKEFSRAGIGHLWGVEADEGIYDRMVANIRAALPEGLNHFTPLLGLSQKTLPEWIKARSPAPEIDFVFLDGGDSPREQIDEFHLLDPLLKVGGRILSHDANFRKGKWFVPYIKALDNYRVTVHQVSDEGLLAAVKVAPKPSEASRKQAEAILQKCRREPVEMLGHLTPRWLIRLAAIVLPASITKRLGQGRK
jgi:predicted O-methyltransferase YrrM